MLRIHFISKKLQFATRIRINVPRFQKWIRIRPNEVDPDLLQLLKDTVVRSIPIGQDFLSGLLLAVSSISLTWLVYVFQALAGPGARSRYCRRGHAPLHFQPSVAETKVKFVNHPSNLLSQCCRSVSGSSQIHFIWPNPNPDPLE